MALPQHMWTPELLSRLMPLCFSHQHKQSGQPFSNNSHIAFYTQLSWTVIILGNCRQFSVESLTLTLKLLPLVPAGDVCPMPCTHPSKPLPNTAVYSLQPRALAQQFMVSHFDGGIVFLPPRSLLCLLRAQKSIAQAISDCKWPHHPPALSEIRQQGMLFLPGATSE